MYIYIYTSQSPIYSWARNPKPETRTLALREPWLALPAVDEPLFLKQVFISLNIG